MADVSRSASLSKKLSSVGDLTSKHIYDGVFSAPAPTKLTSSAFSIRADDYRDIFLPSDASLGSSIPFLDLPAADRSDVFGRGRSSGADYAGVFGGVGDDGRFGVPAEELFRESKKKAKSDAHSSRSSKQIKIPASKSQDFPRGSGHVQASKSPTKTRMGGSKSQEFRGSSEDNATSSQSPKIPTITRTTGSKSQEFFGSSKDSLRSSHASKIPTITRATASKSQEFCGISSDNPTSSQASTVPTIVRTTSSKSQEFCGTFRDNPKSSETSKSPTKTRMMHSKSQEFCGSSKCNPSTDELQFDKITDLNVPHQKINQSSKDVTVGMTQIAHLQAIPGYTHTFEEVSPARENDLKKAKRTSMDEADFSIDVSGGKSQGKHARTVSDLSIDKQTSDHAHKEFGVTESNIFEATHSTREGICEEFGVAECHTFEANHSTLEGIRKSQTFSVSSLSTSPLFGNNNYFRRSSSQRSKRSTNNKQSDVTAGSSSPLLELDVNSTAAVSAAALKRAIEEAEAKICWAKELLKGQERGGSTKLSFKEILKVKATSENGPSEAEARRQGKYVDEDTLPKQKGHLNTTATSENSDVNEAGVLKLKEDLNFSTPESQLEDEEGMLSEKLHVVSAQADMSTRNGVNFKSTWVDATFEETQDSFAQDECVNDSVLKEKANSQEEVKSAEKSHNQQGGGEWEAAKQFSQLISGVKNRFVSFISKQADTEKIAAQMDAPSSSGSVKQSEGSAWQVQDADAHVKRATGQDHVEKKQSEGRDCQVQDADAHIKRAAGKDHDEKEIQMNDSGSSGVGETLQDSNIGMKIQRPRQHEVEITVVPEQGKVDHTTASPGAEMLINRQCDLSEPEQDWEVRESVKVSEELKLEEQDHCGEILDDYVACEHEKDKLDTNECEEHDVAEEATHQLLKLEEQDHCGEILDDYVACEHEKDKLDTNECEEHDIAEEATHQLGSYDSKSEANCKDDREAGKEVQDQEPVERVAESFQCKDGTGRQEEGCSWRETKMVNDSEKMAEDFKMAGETCIDELQERVHATKLFMREGPTTIELQDNMSKSAIGLKEVVDDTSKHDEKKLEDVQMVHETCTYELQEKVQVVELNIMEDSKITEHQDVQSKSTVGITEVADDTSEHDEKKLEDVETVEETCTDEPQERVQAADLNSREADKIIENQDVQSKSEVAHGASEHDEKKLKDVEMVGETCTDELQGRVQAADLNSTEAGKIIENQDVQSKSEVAHGASEYDEKKLKDVEMVGETCTDELQGTVQAAVLNSTEADKIIENRDVQSKSEVAHGPSEHDEKKLKDVEMVEETCTDELQEGVQADLNSREADKITENQDVQSKSTVGITEVVDGASEHIEKKPEDVEMVEEACTVELQERVQAADLNSREANKLIENQDFQSKSTVGITKVAEDASMYDEKKLDDAEMVEETCTDELLERIQATYLNSREANKIMEHQDVQSKSTVSVTEAVEDTSEDDEFLVNRNIEACLHDESSQYPQNFGSSNGEEKMEEPTACPVHPRIDAKQQLIFCKNEEACVEHLGSFSGGEEERMEEPATCSFDSQIYVEHSIYPEIATQPVKEDMPEQILRSFEVVDDILEHDDYFPETDHVLEQEKSSMRRDKDTNGCYDTDQCPQDVEYGTLEKEMMIESTNTISETKGSREQPSSVHTINDLIQKEMYEQSGCFIDEADETLAHGEECPRSVDVCKKEVHSCQNGDNEAYDEHDTQNSEFSSETERMTESDADISAEPECNAEQPSSLQTTTNLIGEDMSETSTSNRTREDSDVVEEEIEDTLEELPHTCFHETQCETGVDFEQKHPSEETFAIDIGSKHQDDNETEFRTDVGEVDMASDEDIRFHDAETSYTRKRWFENRDEGGEFDQSSSLLGAKITLELDQEKNIQGTKVDNGVENHVDERVNKSVEGTNVKQTEVTSSLEDGWHGTEATHRRRRWFENTRQEVLHKPEMDEEPELVEKLVNEGEEGTNLREDDLVESRATAEAAHRRRRWFENKEKLEPVQKPSIQEEETEMGADAAKHGELDETSTAGVVKSKQKNQLNNKEKEKERERRAVERVIREARQRAFAEAKERAAAEARQKSEASSAQDRQGKDSSEAKSGPDKASMDAKLRAERAAVERATTEARERALQRAMSEKAASKTKEKDSKNQTSGTSSSSGYSSAHFVTEKSTGVVSESPRRRRAISERQKRTMERAAKALEEKNMRDSLAQKEQAERNRFADGLDADVKRWLSGKDGNLRAMLSTLQYILGPDSGWQPIPLTDLVASTAVRKAYKRAALCVHPDKLQQRGATIQQKYICEKVFDLLKNAWHRFNPDD